MYNKKKRKEANRMNAVCVMIMFEFWYMSLSRKRKRNSVQFTTAISFVILNRNFVEVTAVSVPNALMQLYIVYRQLIKKHFFHFQFFFF